MDGTEVLEVLKEIRDEVKQTNTRLDQTNTRLESLEGRVEFLEKRVTKGFSEIAVRVETYAQMTAQRQADIDVRLHSAMVDLREKFEEIGAHLEAKLDEHEKVEQLETRVSTLERRLDEKPGG